MQVHQVREYGSDFVTTLLALEPASDVPLTGLTNADVKVRVYDPTTGITTPATFTIAEIDSANVPGWYSLSVAAADLNDTESTQSVLVYPDVAGAFAPQVFSFDNVPMGWNAFFVSWSTLFERIATMAGLVGVR